MQKTLTSNYRTQAPRKDWFYVKGKHDSLNANDLRNLDLDLPDSCPMCRKAINPEFLGGYEFKLYASTYYKLICACPNAECLEVFIAAYEEDHSFREIRLQGCAPFRHNQEVFNDAVQSVSPDFVKIYNQAKHAEERKLDTISVV
ncbi:hypothetical protein PAAL109150_01810 [Paenibacillus alkaliterrae]